MLNKKWTKGVMLALAVAAVLFYFNHGRQEEHKAKVGGGKEKAARAVTVLPPGTEEAWNAYIDRRIDSTLERRGSAVRLNDYFSRALSKTIFVSIYSPYEISCDIIGSSIKFGFSECAHADKDASCDEISPIFFYMVKEGGGGYMNPDPSGEQPPPLGVAANSTAADELTAHICQRINDRVQAIFSPQITSEAGK